MELLRIKSVFMIVCLVQQARAACDQDLQKDQGFTNCITSYSLYMANAGQSVDMTDTSAMAGIMCGDEGKAAMNCVLDYLVRCPDLATSDNPMAMGIFSSVQAISQLGGLDAYCGIVSSLAGPCQPVQQCLSGKGFDEPEMTSSYPTPFSFMQLSIKGLCGPFKEMLGCFKEVGDKCSELEMNIQKAIDMGQSSVPTGNTFPTYMDAKMFVMKECSKLPGDFGTNTCVKTGLVSDEFVRCYENITTVYSVVNNTVSCNAYKAGHQCMQTHVGVKCGQQYTNAFVKVTPMFLAGVPKACKLTTVPVDGAGQHFISGLAALTSVLISTVLSLM